jgi:alpha-glucoside transport system permease protein
MSQVIVDETETDTGGELPQTTHGVDPKGRALTRTLVVVGFALIVALFFLLLFSTPVEDPARIALGPVSQNTFFMWLGELPPLAQIPIVLVAFGIVVAILLVLIEFAPRPGKGYFIMRLVACLVIPVLSFMLLRPYANAVLYVVAIALLSGASSFEVPWGRIMAASVIVTVPLIVLVLVFQRRIVAGLTAGGVKG